MNNKNKINLLSTRFHVCKKRGLVYNGLHKDLIGKSGEVALLTHPFTVLLRSESIFEAINKIMLN